MQEHNPYASPTLADALVDPGPPLLLRAFFARATTLRGLGLAKVAAGFLLIGYGSFYAACAWQLSTIEEDAGHIGRLFVLGGSMAAVGAVNLASGAGLFQLQQWARVTQLILGCFAMLISLGMIASGLVVEPAHVLFGLVHGAAQFAFLYIVLSVPTSEVLRYREMIHHDVIPGSGTIMAVKAALLLALWGLAAAILLSAFPGLRAWYWFST
jgi:hypothetical protein